LDFLQDIKSEEQKDI